MTVNDIGIVFKLLSAYARQHIGRTFLTLLSTVAAAAIVVWVVSSYDSLVEKFDDFADKYLGRYSLIVIPVPNEDAPSTPFGATLTLSEDVVAALRKDPSVAAVDAVFQTRASVTNLNAPPEPPPTPPKAEEKKTDEKGKAGDAKGATPPGQSQAAMNTMMRGRANRTPMLVGTDAIEPPYEMTEGKWLNSKDKESLQAVITSLSADALKLKVGDEVEVGSTFGRGEQMTLKIVGIVEQRQAAPQAGIIIGLPSRTMNSQPLQRGPASAALYVPVALAEKISGNKAAAAYAGVVLKPSANAAAFQQAWTDKFAADKTSAELQTLANVESELDQSSTSENVRAQAWSATGISLLASLFIIFTTLSMGVDERIRQFAVLRAVTCTKSQIALLIMLEGLALGLVGWAGGLLAGWGLLQLTMDTQSSAFLSYLWSTYIKYLPPDPRTQISGAASLGWWCVILSGLCAVGGSLAASILPAWKATRVRPLDALAPANRVPAFRFPWLATLCGFGLIAINPILVFYVPMPDTSRYLISALFGCTAMGIGFILLAPLAIIATERILGPVLALVLGLNPQLLSQQLSSNFWRTLGTSVALTLGLGLYVSMQVWGYSMLNPYMPGKWWPDMVAGLTPSGVPDAEIASIGDVPGIKKGQVVPIANQQVKFVDDITNSKKGVATSSRQDNCVMMGVDGELAFGGEKPMFDFRYVDGKREDVVKKFKTGGRYCVVPDHFARETNLKIGEKFAVRLPAEPDKSVEYEIAGVVNMNGWHWMSKGGLRNNGGGRSAGLMFAPIDTVRKDFDIKQVSFFWFNLDGTKTEDEVKESLQAIATKFYKPTGRGGGGRGRGGFGGGRAPAAEGAEVAAAGTEAAGAGAAGAAAATTPSPSPRGFGRGGGGANVQFRTVASVRAAMSDRAVGIFRILSRLPLITLYVTSLGVINTVLASIRARKWDMGIMRSVGVTRFQLFRLILAEALLIGIVACLLSLAFGAMAGYCGVGVTRYVNVRGGQVTTLIIPWIPILYGFAITLSLCLIASIWPAIRTAFKEPLTLLQQGRTAI
ncbi:ABC transporter permease [Anatilimnocola floriformis]|uniref:ABC transporter permease n=1 Tax=Anatilimnocola floriformis TaxID=2948575 RepID=UPI0020C4DF5E|nr:ABC transporter permease [Anatilimnocola floriformis]